MRKKGYKGRTEKRILSKCNEVCRTYDAIQFAYADILQTDDSKRVNSILQNEESEMEFV